MWMDSSVSHVPDYEDRDGSQNVGLLAIKPPAAAASLRIFY
jgi:hypothetical protein